MDQGGAHKHPYTHIYIFFISRLGNAQGPSEYTFLFQGGKTAIPLEAVKSFHRDNSKVLLIQFLPRILGLVKERAKFNGLQLKKNLIYIKVIFHWSAMIHFVLSVRAEKYGTLD